MEADEFDAFYTIAFSRLVNQIYAMIGDRAEAQDCVQEAFARAWSHRRKLDGSRSPEAWVRVTAYRLAVSHWRQAVRSRRSPDRAMQPLGDQPPPDEARVALMRALDQLPPAQRHAPCYTICATCPSPRSPPWSAHLLAPSRPASREAGQRCILC